ncbi:MAG: bifunctional 2-polyprenyl-6-hydroxyphenol methylase/3-demethylubiquinol 3-O-methyltransferase UbiG [Alphaproteobacteria bacterium]|nr:bifunctional 2-polyprenyl-6-hydroxyphenol methylase/3-demethylubiquinol 3-O-methyltransferase UbiG [Alphaproteobacteria bacterium]
MTAAASSSPRAKSSVDPAEVARFAAMSEAWWDPHGQFRPLHRLNPVRLRFIRDRMCRRFGRDSERSRPLSGLKLLDIGCGGGLIAEPMTRLGADVVGIDAAERNIGTARLHAEESGLTIDYRHATAEDLASAGEAFDIVLALEIVEHVADLGVFLAAASALVKPGGALVLATLNRTAKAFVLAIAGAEYVLGWLPRGTHDWRKFVRPSELERNLRRHGLTTTEISGVCYRLLTDDWTLCRDVSVNYMALAERS